MVLESRIVLSKQFVIRFVTNRKLELLQFVALSCEEGVCAYFVKEPGKREEDAVPYLFGKWAENGVLKHEGTL